ncbi:MAG: hypothetical protein IJ848_00475 [Alphaproteobacteria bacterium]|nr:hypothetical protein [Alphaproteobacteria bacterium]
MIYRYFTEEETLQEAIKQILSDYYSINNLEDSYITNICEDSEDIKKAIDLYNISYKKRSNFIELSKSDSEYIESTIDISNENYIFIAQYINTSELIQEFVNKVLNSYSTTLNNGESIDSTISYNTETNLFENNEKYCNFIANDNKYAIFSEIQEADEEDEETINQINIYPITDKILTIDTDKSASEIFDDFINNYEEAYNKVQKLSNYFADILLYNNNYSKAAILYDTAHNYINAAYAYRNVAHNTQDNTIKVKYSLLAAKNYIKYSDQCSLYSYYYYAGEDYVMAVENVTENDCKVKYYFNFNTILFFFQTNHCLLN